MKIVRRYASLACMCFFTATAGAQSYTTTSLDKGWEFSRTDTSSWLPATVPGTVHTDLMAHHLIPDPYTGMNEGAVQWVDKKDWQYRTVFTLNKELLNHDEIALDLKGLDTYADVYINGHLLLESRNMFVEHKVSIKQWIKEGDNQLRILFHSPIKYDMPKFLQEDFIYPAGNDASAIPLSIYARKAPFHYGWDWGPRLVTSGIWRPIYLQAWNKVTIEDTWLKQQELTDKKATIQANIALKTLKAGKYTIRIESPDKQFTPVTIEKTFEPGNETIQLPFTIRDPHRWWPNELGDPYLYKVKVSVISNNVILSEQQRRIGLRTITVVNAPDSLGESFYVKVNGQPVFMKGADYIPQDNFQPRVTMERYRHLFDLMKRAHFNMVRVWGGGTYEDDRFYDLADEMGMLVWQDFMFACTSYPSDTAFLNNVKEEVTDNITRLRNHPSLALWCGNNEIGVAIDHWGWKSGYGYTDQQWGDMLKGYDKLFKEVLPAAVKALDPGTFYFPSSPISNWGTKEDFTKGDNHYWGVWHGMEWFDAFETHIPRFMSEYGFQSFPDMETVKQFTTENDWDIYSPVMLSHQKSATRGNAAIRTYLLHYYQSPKDFASFLYVNQVLQAEGIKTAIEAHRRAMPFCMGTLYWQLDDCWPGPSWSGIDYYGRPKAMQYFVEKAYKPILVANVVKAGHLQTYLVSDKLKDEKATLEMQLMDMDGKVLWQKKQANITIAGGKSVVIHDIPLNVILQGVDTSKVILYTKVVNEREVLSDNVFYFAKAKDLQLPAPGLHINYDKENGKVTVSTEKLAKNVYLSAGGVTFSDNYFDLLPGQERIISIDKPLPRMDGEIQVISLIDTFKN